ncbi:hypothetical protein BACI71_70373 [Bacillus mycoides]|uniref:Uncharacterized protein n=1 Tax=Bacillus mycoides TaxID=1405 RepID=A0A654BDM0_BACMY|nr:hypothetical protein BACI71_70373 [Bacillus mycoides]
MEVGTDGLIIFNSNGRKIKFIETDTFNTSIKQQINIGGTLLTKIKNRLKKVGFFTQNFVKSHHSYHCFILKFYNRIYQHF